MSIRTNYLKPLIADAIAKHGGAPKDFCVTAEVFDQEANERLVFFAARNVDVPFDAWIGHFLIKPDGHVESPDIEHYSSKR